MIEYFDTNLDRLFGSFPYIADYSLCKTMDYSVNYSLGNLVYLSGNTYDFLLLWINDLSGGFW